MTRLLIISNGHGEDTMGVLLGKALRERGIVVSAFPLVGEGRAYVSAGLPVVGVQKTMPSGGFILEGVHGLWQDLRAGLLGLTWRQMRAMRQLSKVTDWVLGVGDVYPLLMKALSAPSFCFCADREIRLHSRSFPLGGRFDEVSVPGCFSPGCSDCGRSGRAGGAR